MCTKGLDSFSHAFDSIVNLFNRLNDPEKERISYDARLINILAKKLYHLDLAIDAYKNEMPQDALIQISYENQDSEYGNKVIQMYEQWGKERNMRMKQVRKTASTEETIFNYMVTGFGAYKILSEEIGYHIFEVKDTHSGKFLKHKIKVMVLPMELEDYRQTNKADVTVRFSSIKEHKNARRYRLQKSPFVRDLKRNKQTGKVERVLSGYFDVIV